MSNRIVDAQALRQSIISASIGGAEVVAKTTRKGQRSALAKSGSRQVTPIAKDVFASPLGFTEFADLNELGFASLVEAERVAREGSNAEAVEALRALRSHRAYVGMRFDEAFTISDIARLNKREASYQRFGGINLGLAGYADEDVVQLGTISAYAEELVAFLVHEGRINAEDAQEYRLAFTQRSLVDFEDAVEATDVVRYSVTERDGYLLISKKDTGKIVARLAERGRKFAELAHLIGEREAGIEFTIGQVYRHILKVRRAGISAIRSMLEGHTFDGSFTPSVEASADERKTYEFRSQVEANLEQSLIVASAEDEFITRKFSIKDERAELLADLRKKDLLPIEAEAVAFVTLLNEGYSISELTEQVFADVSKRKFNEIQRAAQDLLRK